VIADHDHATCHRHVTHVIVKYAIWRDPATTITHPRESTGPTTGNLTHIVSRRHQRISKWDIEMDWTGVLFVARNSERSSHDGTHVQRCGYIHLYVPAHGSTKKVLLIDRLICSDSSQNRRPIGSHRNERHSRIRRLHNCWMQIDCSGARRRDNCHRTPLNFGNTECKIARRTFIKSNVKGDVTGPFGTG
jgi:hypothetical protein